MSEDIEAAVNAVADRIGVAAERLAPVAETMVRETALRHWVWAGILFAVSGALLCVLVSGRRELREGAEKIKGMVGDPTVKRRAEETQQCKSIIWLIFAALFGALVIGAASDVGYALSPTVTLLERLQ